MRLLISRVNWWNTRAVGFLRFAAMIKGRTFSRTSALGWFGLRKITEGKAAMSTRGISRVIAHQMNTFGGPSISTSFSDSFPAATREQIERAVYRWCDRQTDKKLLRYGEHQVGLANDLTSTFDDYVAGDEFSATITDLQEAAERAAECRIPISVSDANDVLKLTGETMKGGTYGDAAHAILRWGFRQDMPSLAELQEGTPWKLDAALLDEAQREAAAQALADEKEGKRR